MAELQHLLDTLTSTHHLLPTNFFNVDLISPVSTYDVTPLSLTDNESSGCATSPRNADDKVKVKNGFADYTSEDVVSTIQSVLGQLYK
jgi:hypothetical protein